MAGTSVKDLDYRVRTYDTDDGKFVTQEYVTEQDAIRHIKNVWPEWLEQYADGTVVVETACFTRFYTPIKSLEWEDQPIGWGEGY